MHVFVRMYVCMDVCSHHPHHVTVKGVVDTSPSLLCPFIYDVERTKYMFIMPCTSCFVLFFGGVCDWWVPVLGDAGLETGVTDEGLRAMAEAGCGSKLTALTLSGDRFWYWLTAHCSCVDRK